MIFSNSFTIALLVTIVLVAAVLGALALSALGLAWYTAPVAVVAFLAGKLTSL